MLALGLNYYVSKFTIMGSGYADRHICKSIGTFDDLLVALFDDILVFRHVLVGNYLNILVFARFDGFAVSIELLIKTQTNDAM